MKDVLIWQRDYSHIGLMTIRKVSRVVERGKRATLYDVSISPTRYRWHRSLSTLVEAKRCGIRLLLDRRRIHPGTFGSLAPSVILRKMGKARWVYR